MIVLSKRDSNNTGTMKRPTYWVLIIGWCFVGGVASQPSIPPAAGHALFLRNQMVQGVSNDNASLPNKIHDIQSAAAVAPATMAVNNSVPVIIDGNRALVPLSVGSNSIYAMVDTGCTDMTVTESIADKLLAAGQATRIGDSDTTLADGTHRKVRTISINTVTIGGHGISNVPREIHAGFRYSSVRPSVVLKT
jgi:hypothetical protein